MSRSLSRFVAVICLCLLAPLVVLSNEPDAGFEPLFNGRDLSGWEGNLDVWKVEEDQIVGDTQGIDKNQFLATKEKYGDFELRLEFRLKDGQGNSGIQFRSMREPDSTAVIGYQADIGEKYWGCLYDEHRRNKVLVQAPPELDAALKKGDWNTYIIRAEGDHITLTLNGIKTVDYKEEDETIDRSGIIALQVHSGGPLRVEFRKIRLKKL